MSPHFVPIVGLVVFAACSGNGLVCTSQFVPGIFLEVRDSVTAAPLAAGARGIVQDGAFIDSLRPYNEARLQAAGERPGTYLVAVTHPGYADWRVADVRVERDACHVNTATVQARLQPAP